MSIKPQHIIIQRPEDRITMGTVLIGHGSPVQATRTRSGRTAEFQHFPTLDAAAAWVAGNPCRPDLTQYGHSAGVYGPELANWNGYILVGHVWNHSSYIDPCMGSRGDIQASPFVVVAPDGYIRARLAFIQGTWKVTLARPDAPTLRRQSVRLEGALRRLCSEIGLLGAPTTAHERMRLLHQKTLLLQQIPSVFARAEAFLLQRPAWVAALDGTAAGNGC